MSSSNVIWPPSFYRTTHPPPFGHLMLEQFSLDPDYINLNHGSYGTLPRPVQAYCTQISAIAESNPDLFHRFTYMPMLVSVRERIAKLVGVADVDEVVIVPNSSHGLNTVLKNIIWEEGDVIVPFSTTYNSISRTAQYISDVRPHPRIAEFRVDLPTSHAVIIENWRTHLRSLKKEQGSGSSKTRIVAIIDSISSNPGALMPWREMVTISKKEGVWSVVDAAHSIGQEVGIDLDEAQPDFWVSNCHKWLLTKRSCAVLYVPKRNQHIIKSSFPTSAAYISPTKRTTPNFVEQFEWNGTINFIPYLSIAAALDFRTWIGGEEAINTYCHDLAIAGGKKLAETMGTKVMDADGELTVNMVNVSIPFPHHVLPTPEIDAMIKRKLLYEHKAFGPVYYHNATYWVRCSAQIWNEVSDFEKLGKALVAVCAEVVRELGLDEKVQSKL